jgi:hypothetical protein
MELSREGEQTKSKEEWIYGEVTQPRSHLLKEQLIPGVDSDLWLILIILL